MHLIMICKCYLPILAAQRYVYYNKQYIFARYFIFNGIIEIIISYNTAHSYHVLNYLSALSYKTITHINREKIAKYRSTKGHRRKYIRKIQLKFAFCFVRKFGTSHGFVSSLRCMVYNITNLFYETDMTKWTSCN